MNPPAKVECLNLASIAAEQRPLTPLWVRLAKRHALRRLPSSFGQNLEDACHRSFLLDAAFRRAKPLREGSHRLSRHCTPLCSYFVLAQSSVNRKQNSLFASCAKPIIGWARPGSRAFGHYPGRNGGVTRPISSRRSWPVIRPGWKQSKVNGAAHGYRQRAQVYPGTDRPTIAWTRSLRSRTSSWSR